MGSGLTPEAKKARQEELEKRRFAEAAKRSLTLYVREKDGTALTRSRYLALKSSFAHYVAKMIKDNKVPPLCDPWQHSRSVVRIPMATESDVKWIRSFLDQSYLVQSDEDFNRSKGQVYVAFLRDSVEPEFTAMTPDKLSLFINFFRRQNNIRGLFDLKMAAKTSRGKAVHLVMDEEAERVFLAAGCKIPFAGAGLITFEERSKYIARIKALEREKMKPRPSNLDLESQQVAKQVEQVDLSGSPDLRTVTSEETASGEDSPVVVAMKLAAKTAEEGSAEAAAAQAQLLEETGLDLSDVVPRKGAGKSPSWHEEIEHARKLETEKKREKLMEESEKGKKVIGGGEEEEDDNNDQARFEMEQDAQDGQRAVSSNQVPMEEAASLPSGQK